MQNIQTKENEKMVIDFSQVPENLLKKMKQAAPECLNPTLVEISKNEVFIKHPRKFDLVLTQTNPESQLIMYKVVNSNFEFNRALMEYLLFFRDNPKKQERIIKYVKIPDIIYDEFFAITMINIEDDYVEENLRECFKKGLIKNRRDFKRYYSKYLESSHDNDGIKKVLSQKY